MLCISGCGGYLIWLLQERFNELPTRITIENQYQPIVDMPYPAITICSPNQITISSVNHFFRTLVINSNGSPYGFGWKWHIVSLLYSIPFNLTTPSYPKERFSFYSAWKDGNLTTDVNKTLPQLLGFYIPIKLWDEGTLEHLQSLIDENRHTVPEVMISLPQDCGSFLKMCSFQQKLYPNCRGLMRPLLTMYGLCCVFNSIYYLKGNKRNEKDPHFKSHKVHTTGVRFGLSVVTDYDPYDAVDQSIINAGAIRVMFNDMTEFPSVNEMKVVSSHTESFHIIHASYTYCSQEVETLPSSSRNCYFAYENRLPYFADYHNSDCGLLCVIRAVDKVCQCLLFSVPYVKTHRACNITSIACILKVKGHLYNFAPSEQCECKRDCNYRRYQVDTSIGNLKGWSNVLNDPFASLANKINKSTSLMHFYFSSPTFVQNKEETVMSLTTVSSNLGGVFGVCLGFSIISIMEILFYVYLYVKNIILHRLRRRRTIT